MIQYLLPTSPQAFLTQPLPPGSDGLTLGIRALDEDHHLLLGVLDHINAAVISGHDKPAIRPHFHRLVAHTQFHFAREERFFRDTLYPHAAHHEREHRDLLRDLLSLQARFESSSTFPPKILDLLNLWFTTHIQHSDSQYAPFLRSHAPPAQ